MDDIGCVVVQAAVAVVGVVVGEECRHVVPGVVDVPEPAFNLVALAVGGGDGKSVR